jgi:hypothetical protein
LEALEDRWCPADLFTWSGAGLNNSWLNPFNWVIGAGHNPTMTFPGNTGENNADVIIDGNYGTQKDITGAGVGSIGTLRIINSFNKTIKIDSLLKLTTGGGTNTIAGGRTSTSSPRPPAASWS